MRQGRARRRLAVYSRVVRPRFKDPMVMISARPASVEDRAPPWPLGRRLTHRSHRIIRGRHARGTLDPVRAAALLAQYRKIVSELGLEVYCCDPHSPWRRGTNENANGLLRQYMPKGAVLSLLTGADPGAIADQRGDRPHAKR